MNPTDWAQLMVRDAFWAAIAAAGFAILFNVPHRTLPGCAFAAAAGHMTRTLLAQMGLDAQVATLAGATLIGFTGVAFARRWHTPAMVFTISAAITLVPGVVAYKTMLGLLELTRIDPAQAAPVLAEVAVNAARTAFTLGSIAVGIATPSLLLFRNRPVA
ncbi:MAG: threonine/serine exporter family protein [Anaerolineaceae bacterium]|nr:threonine/serine exporter family protein [Anaerolineaceae bacterium]